MFGFLRKNLSAKKTVASFPPRLAIAAETRATAMGEDGIVFLHAGTGKLFTANRVGARIWRGLAEQASLQSIAAGISRELGVPQRQVEEDATEFIAALEACGLVSRERAWS